MSTKMVQTNEVQRCACLLPAFVLVSRESERALSVVDIGASAGLNLLWDRYGYDYGPGGTYGSADSRVQIACTLRGRQKPRISQVFSHADSRVGIHLNP